MSASYEWHRFHSKHIQNHNRRLIFWAEQQIFCFDCSSGSTFAAAVDSLLAALSIYISLSHPRVPCFSHSRPSRIGCRWPICSPRLPLVSFHPICFSHHSVSAACSLFVPSPRCASPWRMRRLFHLPLVRVKEDTALLCCVRVLSTVSAPL